MNFGRRNVPVSSGTFRAQAQVQVAIRFYECMNETGCYEGSARDNFRDECIWDVGWDENILHAPWSLLQVMQKYDD